MIYYHGSSTVVPNPDVLHSGMHLDFGKGFYVTTIEEQAVRWAKRKAMLCGKNCGVVSIYEVKEATGHYEVTA